MFSSRIRFCLSNDGASLHSCLAGLAKRSHCLSSPAWVKRLSYVAVPNRRHWQYGARWFGSLIPSARIVLGLGSNCAGVPTR
jgi:hypothetical protein